MHPHNFCLSNHCAGMHYHDLMLEVQSLNNKFLVNSFLLASSDVIESIFLEDKGIDFYSCLIENPLCCSFVRLRWVWSKAVDLSTVDDRHLKTVFCTRLTIQAPSVLLPKGPLDLRVLSASLMKVNFNACSNVITLLTAPFFHRQESRCTLHHVWLHRRICWQVPPSPLGCGLSQGHHLLHPGWINPCAIQSNFEGNVDPCPAYNTFFSKYPSPLL
jgi:hypothetical protein